jgi:hypothetical protein
MVALLIFFLDSSVQLQHDYLPPSLRYQLSYIPKQLTLLVLFQRGANIND